MKRMICLVLAILLVGAALTACSLGKKKEAAAEPSASASQEESKTIHGVINRLGSSLVLLTDEGEHQAMDYGKDLKIAGFAEGDKVNVTYTGELGKEDVYPVVIAIEKAD